MPSPFVTIKPINLRQKGSTKWVENSVDVSGDHSSGVETGFLSLSISRGKLLAFYSSIFLVLAVLIVKSFMLQIVGGDNYLAQAENNRIKIEYNKAHRGIIVDRNGKSLVDNLFGFSLSILLADLPKDQAKRQEVLQQLADIIKTPLKDIESKLSSADPKKSVTIPLLVGLPYDQAMLIKINAAELPGVKLSDDAWRLYYSPEAFAHILGYIGKIDPDEYEKRSDSYLLDDNIGKAGLEKQYESLLKGVHGEKRIEVDALGREKKIVSQIQAVPGDNLVLSIDADLQRVSYEALKKTIPNGRGSVIISNCQNGEILAMADYPSYDNNLFTGGINNDEYKKLLANPNNPLFTRSIFGEYPSGSTVKQVMAAAALQEGIVNANTTVNSTGGLSLGQWFFPDWKAGGHGITNVTKALAMSVNTFFYYVGGGFGDFKGLGLERIDKYLTAFGLGSATGIDLPGERSGFVPTAKWKKDTKGEAWYIGDTYHLSIGQGDLLVTPLQVNNYTAAVANGGKLFQPRLAMGTIGADGILKPFAPKLIRTVPVSAENLAIVREGMHQTVLSGSARSMSSLPVSNAGKTGTAQWNTTKANHAWYAGFAPFENPNFCIAVLVEEGGEGSSIAVPIAKEIMQWWFGGRPALSPLSANSTSTAIDKK